MILKMSAEQIRKIEWGIGDNSQPHDWSFGGGRVVSPIDE